MEDKEKHTEQLAFKLPVFMAKLLRQVAYKRRQSVSWIIREYIREGISNEKYEKP